MEKQENDESSIFRRISITGLKVLEDIISFPEKVTKKLSVWIKDDLDAIDETVRKIFYSLVQRDFILPSLVFDSCSLGCYVAHIVCIALGRLASLEG